MAFEYTSTFIAVAEDCPVDEAVAPPSEYRGKPTVAAQEFAMLRSDDFTHTMSEVLSAVWVARKGGDSLAEDEKQALFDEYFGTERACFRASPLAKRYGWGFVFNADGKVALVACDSDEYTRYQADDSLKQLKAMASKRPAK